LPVIARRTWEDGGRAREREEGRGKRGEEQTGLTQAPRLPYLLAGGATTSSSLSAFCSNRCARIIYPVPDHRWEVEHPYILMGRVFYIRSGRFKALCTIHGIKDFTPGFSV
jgi:hypothetical protein